MFILLFVFIHFNFTMKNGPLRGANDPTQMLFTPPTHYLVYHLNMLILIHSAASNLYDRQKNGDGFSCSQASLDMSETLAGEEK